MENIIKPFNPYPFVPSPGNPVITIEQAFIAGGGETPNKRISGATRRLFFYSVKERSRYLKLLA